MTQHLRGDDRIRQLTINAQVKITTQRVKRHRQICADCHPADSWPDKACDDGWELAKAAHKAMNAQREFQRSLLPPAPGEQGTLW